MGFCGRVEKRSRLSLPKRRWRWLWGLRWSYESVWTDSSWWPGRFSCCATRVIRSEPWRRAERGWLVPINAIATAGSGGMSGVSERAAGRRTTGAPRPWIRAGPAKPEHQRPGTLEKQPVAMTVRAAQVRSYRVVARAAADRAARRGHGSRHWKRYRYGRRRAAVRR